MNLNIAELEMKTREELMEVAKGMGVSGHTALKKQELVLRLLEEHAKLQGYTFGGGVLEITSEGYGFLRRENLKPGSGDIYLSQSQSRRFGLRTGDMVTGQVRPPKNGEKYYSLLPHFESLTPVFPNEFIDLETTPSNLSTRLLNLIAPIGRGQRGLIVSPPKAGKTMLLKHIANGTTTNYSDIHLMVCLIGERPEEVTDMQRSVKGEVVASTFDEPVESHAKVAELALDRAKRLAENGKDVMILLDSITRLTRAYNLALPPTGRTLSGGLDSAALYPPKRFFGAARNIEEGGSLTVIATCIVDTGSRMDELIYEEFKGTGNMEIHLDRKLADRRVFPAMDIQRSGTRREELLLDEATLQKVWLLRRMVNMVSSGSGNSSDATERVVERLAKTRNNAEFLATLAKEM